MTSDDRPVFLRQLLVAVFWVAVGAALTIGVYRMMSADAEDRPPIIVANGTIHVEEAAQTGTARGKLLKDVATGAATTWYHDHSGAVPKKMDVLVSGVDSSVAGNCSTTANFFMVKVGGIQAVYSVPGGNDRAIDLAVNKGRLEIMVDSTASVTQAPGLDYAADFDVAEAMLKSVTLTRPATPPVTCTFGTAKAPQITVLQRK